MVVCDWVSVAAAIATSLKRCAQDFSVSQTKQAELADDILASASGMTRSAPFVPGRQSQPEQMLCQHAASSKDLLSVL